MPASSALLSLGAQVRSARENRGLTLDETARRTGISKAHLSRIETGERQPAIASLLTLAHALDTRVGTLLGEDDDDCSLSVHLSGAAPRSVNGLEVTPASGYRGSRDLEALHLRIGPDRAMPDFSAHDGEEWLHVVSGTLRLEYGTAVHLVDPGTSVHFDARQPHRLGAEFGDTEVLLVASATKSGFTNLHA